MIKRVIATSYRGNQAIYTLGEPEPESGFIITEIEGLGPADATINLTELATSDGGIVNSARLNSRNIVIKGRFTEAESIEDSRQRSYKIFPIRRRTTIRIETDNRIVETTGYVESNEPVIFSAEESTQISVLCEDPLFYDVSDSGIVVTGFSTTIPMFMFPFMNNSVTQRLIIMGAIEFRTNRIITYEGESEVGFLLDIQAMDDGVRNIRIYNTTTGEVMSINTDKITSITGQAYSKGDTIEISTVKGNKFVHLIRRGVRTNILNSLDKHPDWFQLAMGDNLIGFTAEEKEDKIDFTITTQIVYEGI